MFKSDEMVFIMPDDKTLEIFINNELVGRYDHDTHGWDGMDAAEELAEKIANLLNIKCGYCKGY